MRGAAAAWTAHRDELTAFLVRSTRDHEAAEDILQDAYLHLLRDRLAWYASA